MVWWRMGLGYAVAVLAVLAVLAALAAARRPGAAYLRGAQPAPVTWHGGVVLPVSGGSDDAACDCGHEHRRSPIGEKWLHLVEHAGHATHLTPVDRPADPYIYG